MRVRDTNQLLMTYEIIKEEENERQSYVSIIIDTTTKTMRLIGY
jgi:hypothetical protein